MRYPAIGRPRCPCQRLWNSRRIALTQYLIALSTQTEDGVLDRRAEEAMAHGERAERLVVL